MKILWRLKRVAIFRLLYRLVCWINYPTPRERMWYMFYLGKIQGRKEALKELPITQVQPAIPKIEIKPMHLPPGMWSKLYYETHPEHRVVIPSQHEPAYWPAPFDEHAWLNSKPPIDTRHMTPAEIEKVDTKRDLTKGVPRDTLEAPAIVALIHQGREQRRHAG